jgi:hypothetical protein
MISLTMNLQSEHQRLKVKLLLKPENELTIKNRVQDFRSISSSLADEKLKSKGSVTTPNVLGYPRATKGVEVSMPAYNSQLRHYVREWNSSKGFDIPQKPCKYCICNISTVTALVQSVTILNAMKVIIYKCRLSSSC